MDNVDLSLSANVKTGTKGIKIGTVGFLKVYFRLSLQIQCVFWELTQSISFVLELGGIPGAKMLANKYFKHIHFDNMSQLIWKVVNFVTGIIFLDLPTFAVIFGILRQFLNQITQ